jgi:uncharacterized protein (TIGR02246 family)
MHPPTPELTAAVLRLEDQRRAALVAGDADALHALLAPTLVYVHSTGGRDSRDSYLAKLNGGALRYLEVDFSELRVQPLATLAPAQAAVVTGRMAATITKDGERKAVRSFFMTVWAADAQGRWQLQAHQGTPAA